MINCKNCQFSFVETVNRTTFCSHKCQASFNFKKIIGMPKPGAKKGRIVICITCGVSFYVPKYRIDKGNVKYCSRSCLAKIHLSKFSHCRFQSTNLPKHNYKCVMVNGKPIRIHRHIMQQHLGRKLQTWEHVHHINNNPSDNRLENLIVLSNSDHQKEEHKMRKKLFSSAL